MAILQINLACQDKIKIGLNMVWVVCIHSHTFTHWKGLPFVETLLAKLALPIMNVEI